MPHQIIEEILVALVVAGLGTLFYFGEKEPAVSVDASGIQIAGMYGRRIDFSEITGVTLLEQSMWEIGTGIRTNGYGGLALKGHFSTGLLFVAPSKTPTIQIKRCAKKSVYISFRNREQTRLLYDALSVAVPLAS